MSERPTRMFPSYGVGDPSMNSCLVISRKLYRIALVLGLTPLLSAWTCSFPT